MALHYHTWGQGPWRSVLCCQTWAHWGLCRWHCRKRMIYISVKIIPCLPSSSFLIMWWQGLYWTSCRPKIPHVSWWSVGRLSPFQKPKKACLMSFSRKFHKCQFCETFANIQILKSQIETPFRIHSGWTNSITVIQFMCRHGASCHCGEPWH